jgi:putative SOS response-associated peptidase YedK
VPGPRIVVVVEAAKGIEAATFNARAETVATKPMFRSAFKCNRCLIPVSGYYEWQDTRPDVIAP